MDGLKITIYDKNFQRKGWLGNPESVTVTLGFNVVGSAQVTFRADHPRAKDIDPTQGARLVIEYEGLPQPLISGPVRHATGSGPGGQSMTTVTVEDDLRLLWRLLGWTTPTANILNQVGVYKTYTGNAETIVKTAVADAVARIPSEAAKVTIAPNLNRGAVIRGGIKYRMHALAERMFPAVEQAGLGVRVYQSGNKLLLDVYEPQEYPKVISESAGTLRSWAWSSSAPTVTRVVVGGAGEGTARQFGSLVSGATETQYGDVIEAFIDARSSENEDELWKEMDEAVTEGRAKSGLSVELSETPYFRYGTVQVGDKITIQAGGLTITDVLRTATITWDRKDGLTFKPAVGEIQDSSDAKTAKAIRKLWQGLTNLKVR